MPQDLCRWLESEDRTRGLYGARVGQHTAGAARETANAAKGGLQKHVKPGIQ